jgi:hypothetical protein
MKFDTALGFYQGLATVSGSSTEVENESAGGVALLPLDKPTGSEMLRDTLFATSLELLERHRLRNVFSASKELCTAYTADTGADTAGAAAGTTTTTTTTVVAASASSSSFSPDSLLFELQAAGEYRTWRRRYHDYRAPTTVQHNQNPQAHYRRRRHPLPPPPADTASVVSTSRSVQAMKEKLVEMEAEAVVRSQPDDVLAEVL